MKMTEIPYARLLRQRIAGEGLDTPADVVRWMGALQAQDFAAAKWAVGLRTRDCTEAQVEAAFAAGDILRTHVMRPTWHFVAAEDIRWMQALTAARVHTIMSYQYRQLELDAPTLKKSRAAIEKVLRGGKQLTRAELGTALAKARIPADGLRLAHIVSHAELEAVLCSGGRKGKQFTYALVEERAPQAKVLKREEALGLLTRRFFTSRGPATPRDFAWWSGLASADVKEGLELVKSELASDTVDGQVYWMTASAPAERHAIGAVHLLGNFDEYIVGYSERGAIFDSLHAEHLDARHNPLFNHTIVSRGRIAGTWTRNVDGRGLRVETRLFNTANKAELRGIGLAVKRLAKYLELGIADPGE